MHVKDEPEPVPKMAVLFSEHVPLPP